MGFTAVTSVRARRHGDVDRAEGDDLQRPALEPRGLRHAVINVDDEWGRTFAARLEGGPLEVITFGVDRRPREGGDPVTATIRLIEEINPERKDLHAQAF